MGLRPPTACLLYAIRRIHSTHVESTPRLVMINKDETTAVAPFLKWAGGKQWILPRLIPLLSSTRGRYFEPFLGGGAVFFGLQPPVAILSDLNAELVEMYQAVRDDAEEVISILSRFSFTRECYEKVRNSRPRTPVTRAAKFIYLNRTCWNGLYRVNRVGQFNVPMGSFTSPPNFVVADRIRLAQTSLRRAVLRRGDFEETCNEAGEGDAVYFDPPYTTPDGSDLFRRYNGNVFSWEDHLRLASLATRLANRGCRVVITNTEHPAVRHLYGDFAITVIARRSLVAADPSGRGSTTELLIANYRE